MNLSNENSPLEAILGLKSEALPSSYQ